MTTTLFTLGQVNALFGHGLAMSASYVTETLGVPPRDTRKAAKLYSPSDVRAIGLALAQRALQVGADAPAEPTPIVIQPHVMRMDTDMMCHDALCRLRLLIDTRASDALRMTYSLLGLVELRAAYRFDAINSTLRHTMLEYRLDTLPTQAGAAA